MAPESKLKAPPLYTVFQTNGDDEFLCAAGDCLPLSQIQTTVNINTISCTTPPRKKSRSNCSSSQHQHSQPLKPYNWADVSLNRISSSSSTAAAGKENLNWVSGLPSKPQFETPEEDLDNYHLDSIASTIDCSFSSCENLLHRTDDKSDFASASIIEEKVFNLKERGCYSSNALESRLLTTTVNHQISSDGSLGSDSDDKSDENESCRSLDLLLELCSASNQQIDNSSKANSCSISCPLCGIDISGLTDELRQAHTNSCLDKEETPKVGSPDDELCFPGQVVNDSPKKSCKGNAGIAPVLEWLHGLGLAKYEEIFVKEEIDWDTLKWLTEEDLLSMGVTALGPRKKIVQSLSELRKGSIKTVEKRNNSPTDVIQEKGKPVANKLITDFFLGPVGQKKKDCTSSGGPTVRKSCPDSLPKKKIVTSKNGMNKKFKDIPKWCCIEGTPFRVDAFKYLRRDCSHWFLTHFHIDHYQGLTRSFSHGKIFCSLITAKLVNMKLGIPWEKLQVLPLNEKINIAGIDVTCFDANHCPGSIILLFEPSDGKVVLHTGDFRFCEGMKKIPVLQSCCVQTLILDTTYCDPQYDFPKQDAVIQFVIEAIQAEAFNPKTLFLIGSYTIGKERLFVEVARVLREKVYVPAAKLRLLECLGLSEEDMQWFTVNELESRVHVVPMWTLASIKRLKCVSNQYLNRYSLIVAFSPTGWTFGKGKKKTSGRRWQQGTIVRYEVPYSEHSSFTELREFVEFISPEKIIPSVNNDGPESADSMVSLLTS